MLSSPNACLIIARDYVALFSEIYTKCYAVPFSDTSRNRIRPETRLQIKGCKITLPSFCLKICILPKYASTMLYSCNVLLQLLYRWQYQSRKLWIPVVRRYGLQCLFLKWYCHHFAVSCFRSQYYYRPPEVYDYIVRTLNNMISAERSG
jgi:hypothetical protein